MGRRDWGRRQYEVSTCTMAIELLQFAWQGVDCPRMGE